MKLTTLPQLTQEELHILLAGLDELPGKLSRMLHRKITDHVEAVIRDFREQEAKDAEEIRRAKEYFDCKRNQVEPASMRGLYAIEQLYQNQAQGAAQIENGYHSQANPLNPVVPDPH